MEKIKSRWAKLAVIIAGSFLYTFGMNYFLIPYGLYSGGGVGIAQVLTYFAWKDHRFWRQKCVWYCLLFD